MTQDTEDVVARVKALLAAANEPRPAPLPEQDSRAGEAMAGVEDQRRYARWADRVADAQRQLTALAPELLTDRQSLSDRIDGLEGALRHISEGCGMLNQPGILNGPEVSWLRRRIRESERVARAALHQEGI